MSEDFTAEMPIPQKPQRRPTLKEHREDERLSVGGFYAQHRQVVDERRTHLARLGMDPMHVEALRMPTGQEETLPARGTRMPALTARIDGGPDATEPTSVPLSSVEPDAGGSATKRPTGVKDK